MILSFLYFNIQTYIKNLDHLKFVKPSYLNEGRMAPFPIFRNRQQYGSATSIRLAEGSRTSYNASQRFPIGKGLHHLTAKRLNSWRLCQNGAELHHPFWRVEFESGVLVVSEKTHWPGETRTTDCGLLASMRAAGLAGNVGLNQNTSEYGIDTGVVLFNTRAVSPPSTFLPCWHRRGVPIPVSKKKRGIEASRFLESLKLNIHLIKTRETTEKKPILIV